MRGIFYAHRAKLSLICTKIKDIICINCILKDWMRCDIVYIQVECIQVKELYTNKKEKENELWITSTIIPWKAKLP